MTLDKFVYRVSNTIIEIWSISISPGSSFVPFAVSPLPSPLRAALICFASLEMALLYGGTQGVPFTCSIFQHTP